MKELDQVNFLLNEEYNIFLCHQSGGTPTIKFVLRKEDNIVYIFDRSNASAYTAKAALIPNTRAANKYLKKLMKQSINSVLVDHNRKLDDEILAEIRPLRANASAQLTIKKPLMLLEK